MSDHVKVTLLLAGVVAVCFLCLWVVASLVRDEVLGARAARRASEVIRASRDPDLAIAALRWHADPGDLVAFERLVAIVRASLTELPPAIRALVENGLDHPERAARAAYVRRLIEAVDPASSLVHRQPSVAGA